MNEPTADATGTGSTGAETGPGEEPSRAGGTNPVVIVVAIVAVVAIALVALLATSGGSDEPDTAAQVVSDEAPALAGETISGEAFDLQDLRGEWVLVNFFATWCPPCVAEHPELTAFNDANAFDAKVVSVAFDEPTEKVATFFAENGGDWPVVAQSDEIPLDWAVIGLPESFLVSPDGQVAKKYKGQVTAAGLEADIRELS
ncbi:MAG: TlpA disulfide reductase family protein [Microthrixaceae bacterium]